MYLVAYDVADDKERRKASRILDGYGYGIQRSVYLCHIDDTQARRMFAALKALNLETGFILCWKIADSAEPECLGVCPPGLHLKPERVFII